MSQKKAQWGTGEQLAQDLEERLASYYGPALPPRSLSESAWVQLRDQLSSNAPRRRRQRRKLYIPNYAYIGRRQAVPIELQDTYAMLLERINYRHAPPNLRCRLNSRQVQPRVQSSPLGRGRVRLILPEQNWRALQTAELEVLLAAGLARCAGTSRPLFLLPRVLFAFSCLLLVTASPFTTVDRRALWIFLAAVVCCAVSGSLLSWQQRSLAFRSDRQAVQWLGRERVCQGLHLLAEHGRSRSRPAWGEPSLAERIARVCNSPVTEKDKRLTLVG